jgi:hypothetical protein
VLQQLIMGITQSGLQRRSAGFGVANMKKELAGSTAEVGQFRELRGDIAALNG